MRLANKIAFITGAAEGIGACAAGLFSREGAKVILSDIDEDRGRKVADQVTSAGGDAVFVRCDVTSEASVREAAAAVQERYGALHILYNNVGGSTPRDDRVTDVDLEEFWSAMKLNVLSVVLPARHLIPLIAASGGGSVINTASYMALLGTAGRDCYTASKGAVVSLTRSMAVEFGPDNIRVNVIGPGAVTRNGSAASSQPVPTIPPSIRETAIAAPRSPRISWGSFSQKMLQTWRSSSLRTNP